LRKHLIPALACLGALVSIITISPVTLWWGRALAGPWAESRGEVLIVLGAEEPESGVIGQSTYWRTLYAYRAWQAGGFHTIIVSGGGGVGTSMRGLLMCSGVPADAIRVEARSSSTRENALFTRDIVNTLPGRKVLLTSDYHMFRAVRTFRKCGMEVSPHPIPDVLKHGNWWGNRWTIFQQLLIESAKISGYVFKGWI
jgi:uncharacterized SAM-binding protein YcdF (DUF218 family)